MKKEIRDIGPNELNRIIGHYFGDKDCFIDSITFGHYPHSETKSVGLGGEFSMKVELTVQPPPKPRFCQLLNPISKKWVKIDRLTGRIVACRKKRYAVPHYDEVEKRG
jgi:hypothetical protein